MKLRFTKMHGAGNDFVVLDATREPIELTPEQARRLGDRRFGIGADQILMIERSSSEGIDFRYRIWNGSGDEVEQCGNGARCFFRYVRDKGLSSADAIKVETLAGLLELRASDDGVGVSVNRGAPVFDTHRVPFDAGGLVPRKAGGVMLWPIGVDGVPVEVAVLSMGNPHAVQRVADIEAAPVAQVGAALQSHPAFPRQVNAGVMQVRSRGEILLRVFERGVGETMACGSGACAAAVAGIRLGWLDSPVEVRTHGGVLRIEWAGASGDMFAPVVMTGPAETVFEGEIEL